MLLVAVLVWLSVPGSAWAATRGPREPPTVEIPGQGVVVGREVSVSRNQKSTLYLNIPFAQPPTGNLRFDKPQTDPLPSWTEPRNASAFGPACPQMLSKLDEQDRILTNFLQDKGLEMSEDCLQLNIFTPDGNPPAEGWSVMLWLHSGDFQTGATSLWDGSVLAVRQKVIVVTAAYRLNILGFFTTLDGNAPGNWGLWDQVAAIDWVQSKIAAFGGNRKNITLFGHGAGGVSVGLHVISPMSDGFQAAIAMSGSATTPPDSSSGGVAREERSTVEAIRKLAERFYCRPSTADVVSCMRNVQPVQVLVEAALQFTKYLPVVDSKYNNVSQPFLSDKPATMLEMTPKGTPLMVGYTDHEDAMQMRKELEGGLSSSKYTELLVDATSADLPQPESENNDTCPINGEQAMDAVTFYYTPIPATEDTTLLRQKFMEFTTEKKYGAPAFLQASFSSKVSPTWMYRFDYRLKSTAVGDAVPDWINVPHQYELPFVWGMPFWTSLPSQVVWNSQDKKIADIIMTLWGSFAKTRNPTQQIQGGAVKWEPFTEQNPGVMVLDKNFSMTDVSNFDYRSFAFWNTYYPKVIESLVGCCNQTDGASTVAPRGLHLALPVLAPLLPWATWRV
ncbi:Carboxyl/Cholinesterase 03 [Frankliniella occidentalis]|uniref:Liver carboxylesterase 1 n=1 Tax=Frankliniella occidentalis TaxID=133901 RepID=A0A6J1RUN9_FRAOC|nr:liver carboxylesterase 1 [Frankliniella occidentalis]XP_026272078.1 liver carboxylesterase 1 [Frankliniella occidentalis]XP_052124855.1 liver carboxylesterase 1 [Frankliniella occidentalis]KAE8752521.1 Carboxyl/Cholinesterase 03 [Frankliniella occidentalis]